MVFVNEYTIKMGKREEEFSLSKAALSALHSMRCCDWFRRTSVLLISGLGAPVLRRLAPCSAPADMTFPVALPTKAAPLDLCGNPQRVRPGQDSRESCPDYEGVDE